MSVEFIPAAYVRDVTARITRARQRAVDRCGVPPQPAGVRYWEAVFETNAAEVLSELPDVTVDANCIVRYAFFGQQGRDLLVRPFIARSGTDVDAVRRLLDWHAPPDAGLLARVPTQDVALLYSHFRFAPTVIGVFQYWLAMQELWASARWTHSHLVASAAELSQITAGESWEVVHPVNTYEPAVVRSDTAAHLAVLMHSPLQRFTITLEQIEISADHALRYSDSILVAAGPRGYAS